MNKGEIIYIVKRQLALDMNCSIEDFSKSEIVYCCSEEKKGMRKFPRQSPFLQVLSMGQSIIVTCESGLIQKIKEQFQGRSREDIFVAPFLYGHTLAFLPDLEKLKKREFPNGINVKILKGKEIKKLYEIEGFDNAIQYGNDKLGQDMIVVYAAEGEEIIAMAGASEDCEDMWQIGVDVKSEHRNKGLATALVSHLAIEIIQLGKVPYYCAASSNIPSQGVAYKSGFFPAWMSTYKNTFDDDAPWGKSDI